MSIDKESQAAATDRMYRIIAYARGCFENQIEGILDDPSGWTAAEWQEIEQRAVDLGLPLADLIARGTPFEQNRLREKFKL